MALCAYTGYAARACVPLDFRARAVFASPSARRCLAWYNCPSRSIAHKTPLSRRANATTAIRFPRRLAIPSAQIHNTSVSGFFSRKIRYAACTSSVRVWVHPALVMCPLF